MVAPVTIPVIGSRRIRDGEVTRPAVGSSPRHGRFAPARGTTSREAPHVLAEEDGIRTTIRNFGNRVGDFVDKHPFMLSVIRGNCCVPSGRYNLSQSAGTGHVVAESRNPG